MKANDSIKSIFLLSLSFLALISTHCKKNDESVTVKPTVNTNAAQYIGQKWGTITGSVNAAGGTFKVGFQWDTTTAFTNEAGFTALPGGYRFTDGAYGNIRKYGFWWSSSGISSAAASCLSVINSYPNSVIASSIKTNGFSVRCVKN